MRPSIPTRPQRLNDDNVWTAPFMALTKHRTNKALSLVRHDGVHAKLSRAIPPDLLEGSVVRRKHFDDAREGEFDAVCE
jgi:hypothetical protein